MIDEECRRKCKINSGRVTMEIHLLQKTIAFLAYSTLPKKDVDSFFEAMDMPPSANLEPDVAKALEAARASFLGVVAKQRRALEQGGRE